MEHKYHVTAKIDRVVTQTKDFIIEANSEEEAEKIVREYIQDPLDSVEKINKRGIERVLTTHEDYYIPRAIEIVSNKKIYKK